MTEVETTFGTLQDGSAQLREAEHVAQARARAATAGRQRVDLKLESPLGATASELAAAEADIELVDARTAEAMAYIALFKAMGGAPPPAADKSPGA